MSLPQHELVSEFMIIIIIVVVVNIIVIVVIIMLTPTTGAGAAVGNLVAVSSLSEVQRESYTEATVLLVKHIGGEEDIPEVRSASSQLLLRLTSAPP